MTTSSAVDPRPGAAESRLRPVPGRLRPRPGLQHWRDYSAGDGLDPVLAAAVAAFAEHGYDGASVRDIARRAGLSVPGLYHHHPSKQAMLLALVESSMNDVLARSHAALVEAGPDPVTRFEALVECLVLFMAHRRELGALHAESRALEPANWRRYVSLRDEQERLMVTAVASGQKAGAFTTVESPHDASRAVLTLCLGVAGWYRPDGPIPTDRLARQYIGFCTGLVGGRTAVQQSMPEQSNI